MDTCDPVIERYLATLKSDFFVIESVDECRVVTPYYRPDGDAIEIVLKKLDNGRLRLSDAGQTLDFLFLSGLNLDKNKQLLDEAIQIARRRGALLQNSEISLESNPESEGEALGKLISAIESVTYLIYRRVHRELKPFADEITEYLSDNQVDFQSSFTLQGKIVSHSVSLYLNSNKNLVIEPLSAITPAAARMRAERLAFEVRDVGDALPYVRFIGVIDDRDEERAEVWSDTKANSIVKAIFARLFVWDQRHQLLTFVRNPTN
jgi:Domain of unknown function DUF1828